MNTNKNAFYVSVPWIRLRNYKLSQTPFCERCPKELLTTATEVHHKNEVKTHPELRLDFDNLESLCKSCHSSHTAKQNRPKPGKILNRLWIK